jgi:hypothetical protein
MKRLNHAITLLLITCTFSMGFPTPAYAGIVSTEQIHSGSERDRVRGILERDDVRLQMQSLGVSAEAAQARVDALSDQEVAELAGHLDELPAGGDVVGVLFAVFIILLVTDILGLTKVFPFTRSVR